VFASPSAPTASTGTVASLRAISPASQDLAVIDAVAAVDHFHGHLSFSSNCAPSLLKPPTRRDWVSASTSPTSSITMRSLNAALCRLVERPGRARGGRRLSELCRAFRNLVTLSPAFDYNGWGDRRIDCSVRLTYRAAT
jgi:hypothetical protein